jgi:hypothetical protein
MGIGNMLGLGALSRVTDRASYGDSPFTDENENIRNNLLPTFKPGRYEDVRDAAMALAPVVGKMAPAVRGLVENGALDYGKGALSEMLKGTPPTSMKYQQGAIKPKGGNWVSNSIENHINDLVTGNNSQDTKNWANTTLKKYMKNEMGTENDPMFNHDNIHLSKDELKEEVEKIDKIGVSPDYPYQIPYRFNDSKESGFHNYNLNAKSDWEYLTDSLIQPKKISDIRPSQREPWMNTNDQKTLVNELKAAARSYNNTDAFKFGKMLDHIDRKLTSGELSPEDLKRSPVDLIAKQMGDERVRNEQYVVPTPTKVVDFPSGNSMVKLDKPGQFAKESDAMSHSVRGYEPTDGTIGAGKGGYDNYGTGIGGWKAIQNESAEVHSLRDPKGKPLATIESNYLPEVTQIKGPRNDPVDHHHVSDIIDYLNDNHSDSKVTTPDLTVNNITDTSKFPSQWSHEPEFVNKLNEVTGGKRFVDSNTVKQVYDEHMGSLERANRIQADQTQELHDIENIDWQPEPEQNIPPNQ